MNYSEADFEFMKRALEISKHALPKCRPNPPVGCVIVKNGQIISEGFTSSVGCSHAEKTAIEKLGKNPSLVECSIYVTLEPCSFFGRTPSCAKLIAALHPDKVFVSLIDPHTKNNGKGIEILVNANINVDVGLLEDETSSFITQYLIEN
ncbi:bifunctional diaminohydroxyphosphoribosylaminopyrimidine deaminase/5-amino-6-(5-phosphoribosylamino)uracil reductase RibD [Vibrio cholerae]